jgi:hypothetical protein
MGLKPSNTSVSVSASFHPAVAEASMSVFKTDTISVSG